MLSWSKYYAVYLHFIILYVAFFCYCLTALPTLPTVPAHFSGKLDVPSPIVGAIPPPKTPLNGLSARLVQRRKLSRNPVTEFSDVSSDISEVALRSHVANHSHTGHLPIIHHRALETLANFKSDKSSNSSDDTLYEYAKHDEYETD